MNYSNMASDEVVERTVEEIRKRNIQVKVVNSKNDALTFIQRFIPARSSVFNGSSTTLIQIGFVEYLKEGKHAWENLHLQVLNEKDRVKQSDLRRRALTQTDYFLSSVNAIAQSGELVACDMSGSRVGAFPFAAKKLLLVSGINKIVPTLTDAMNRVREYVVPQEDSRAMKAYGMHTALGKWVIIEREAIPDRTTLILVKESLGF